MNLKEGMKAPDFSLPSQDGGKVKLSDFRGKKIALYFYPKDETSGCTTQACNIRDNWEALKKKGIHVFGVSKDSIESHKKFSEHHKFSFPILSDEKMETLQKYGVWKEKSMYGKTFLGIHRTTFLIDENGKIRKIISKPDVSNHSLEIFMGFES